jgi:MFS family permease
MLRGPLRQLDVFQRAPDFRLLFLARLGSGLGTYLAAVALQIDVFDRTHSGAWISALLIVDFAPAILIGLLLGPLLDRWPRKQIMILSDLVNVAVFAALPFTTSAIQIVVLAGVSGLAVGFFRPVVYAGLPNLVEERDLESANALLQTIENLTILVGPVLGGLIVAATSPHVNYWVNAVSFLLSALFAFRIAADRLQTEQAVSQGHWRDLAAGFSLVRRSAALFTVLVSWNVVMVTIAGVNVAEVVLAKHVFNGGDIGFGVMVGTAGLGLAIGSFVSTDAIGRFGLARAYAGSIALMGVGAGAAAASPNVWVAAACVIVFGAGNGAAVACNYLFVARGAADQLRGRAVTVLMSVGSMTMLAAMVLAGWLTDVVGARWVWGGAAAIAVVAALLALRLARRIPQPSVAETDGVPPLVPPPPVETVSPPPSTWSSGGSD